MREKELRIALVCFGGVSLAIYMHGISKEILKLVRASSALHAITDRTARAGADFHRVTTDGNGEHDTEAVYFELLKCLGRKVELRVVVDIIAGASAGGINGALLARALSHDLPVDRLRDLWLEKGDVGVLLAPEARARTMSKIALRPLFWAAGASGLMPAIRDIEVRRNLSLFMRSRWFQPPLDGLCMAGLMYDAMNVMGAGARPDQSLLPSGQKLDLFVTLTDFYGQHHPLQIHDPPVIHEREHRHVVSFQYRRSQGGVIETDFDLASAPGLAFAARATSSFPGVFPPAQIAEMDLLLVQRSAQWPNRQAFIEKNFPRYINAGLDPTLASFIDGGVLNNRPFREAIAAIHGRPAYRQVDRRIVYIDPCPASPPSEPVTRIPGFFSTVKQAISDLPRAQPVTDELNWIIDFNDRVGQLRDIIDGARPRVAKLVADIVDQSSDWTLAAEQIATWRAQVNAQVVREAGFAYQSYVRLKLAAVIQSLGRLVCELRGVSERSPAGRAIVMTLDLWSKRTVTFDAVDARTAQLEDGTLAPWAQFLLAFDVDYRKRRLNFLIEGQNRLYQMIDQDRYAGLDPGVVDRLKRDFYACLDTLRRRHDPRLFSAEVREQVTLLFPRELTDSESRNPVVWAENFLADNLEPMTTLVGRLEAEVNLAASTRDVDLLLAAMDPAEWTRDARQDVLISYLGFPYWDVLTLPVTTARETGELREILIDRISAVDARTLPGFSGVNSLKGVGFGYFAAFLSRGYRENDYLLGRLHSVDRLIDIVCDSAGGSAAEGVDVLAFKRRAFETILDAEEPHLRQSSDLLAALRRAIMSLGR